MIVFMILFVDTVCMNVKTSHLGVDESTALTLKIGATSI